MLSKSKAISLKSVAFKLLIFLSKWSCVVQIALWHTFLYEAHQVTQGIFLHTLCNFSRISG